MHKPIPLPANVCRDKTDAPLLGSALAGKADFQITGDSDLLVLAHPAAFASFLHQTPINFYPDAKSTGLPDRFYTSS